MPIRQQGYYNWDGSLGQPTIRWWPIFRHGVAAVYRKKYSRLLFAFCSLSFVVFLLAVYASARPDLQILTQMVKQIATDAALFNSYYTNGFLIFMMAVLTLFAGGDLIGDDLRLRSFTLYLSRPLRRFDYLQGKFAIVMFYLLLFTLVPGMLLIVSKYILVGKLEIAPAVFLAAVAFPLLLSLFFAAMILVFSVAGNNSKWSKILFFAAYMISNALGSIFHGIFHDDVFFYVSIKKNIEHFGTYIFATEPLLQTPGWISGCILGGLTMVFLIIVVIRIYRVEV